MDFETVEKLLKASQDSNANIRKAAAIAFAGAADNSHAKSALIKMLKDKVWQVREAAINSMRKAKIVEAADILMKVLGAEDEASARKAILTWAVARSDPAAEGGGAPANPLGGGKEKKKESGDPWQVKKAAALALSAIRPDITANALIGAMGVDNPQAKAAAMVGLGNIKADEAIEPLLEAISSDDWNIRKIAANTLGRLKAKQATDALLNLLNDDKSAVRLEAVIAINHIKPAEGVLALSKVVVSDTNYDVRKTAATALGNLKDESASEALYKALEDDNWVVKKAAIDSLTNLKMVDAMDRIARFLTDEQEDVRLAAAVGLIKLNQIALLS
ncbi:hypothetical protein MNBD_NITROSPINAE02-258 [hydrothermal vent metagenome]|uniref:HEAT repeat domain-containing protein n=1 Tax=hydrothermal vent metagenome TaxID=652676 RepID=A0A3B1D8C8_9ZZZZ